MLESFSHKGRRGAKAHNYDCADILAPARTGAGFRARQPIEVAFKLIADQPFKGPASLPAMGSINATADGLQGNHDVRVVRDVRGLNPSDSLIAPIGPKRPPTVVGARASIRLRARSNVENQVKGSTLGWSTARFDWTRSDLRPEDVQ